MYIIQVPSVFCGMGASSSKAGVIISKKSVVELWHGMEIKEETGYGQSFCTEWDILSWKGCS